MSKGRKYSTRRWSELLRLFGTGHAVCEAAGMTRTNVSSATVRSQPMSSMTRAHLDRVWRRKRGMAQTGLDRLSLAYLEEKAESGSRRGSCKRLARALGVHWLGIQTAFTSGKVSDDLDSRVKAYLGGGKPGKVAATNGTPLAEVLRSLADRADERPLVPAGLDEELATLREGLSRLEAKVNDLSTMLASAAKARNDNLREVVDYLKPMSLLTVRLHDGLFGK